MHDSPISRTGFIAAVLVSILFTISSYFITPLSNSFVVFCDVGQGDASYIHIKPNIDIIIDAGKGSSALRCLQKYMSPRDRIIELAFVSHLQNDHYGGFLSIPNHYEIKQLYVSNTKTTSLEISTLYKLLYKKHVKIEAIYAGESFIVNNARFELIWPTREYIEASSAETDPNDSSQVLIFSLNNHTILYTGDVSPKSLKILLQQSIPRVDVLKIPHHGSKNGLIHEFLVLADPTYGLISSGKNNSYGHPSPEITTMLRENNVEILRTDQIGDVVFNLEQVESL